MTICILEERSSWWVLVLGRYEEKSTRVSDDEWSPEKRVVRVAVQRMFDARKRRRAAEAGVWSRDSRLSQFEACRSLFELV